uniref:Uncharacterized protein n=1 Tax=Mycena chlorophos TaxID=658473 RepID=A0ABQ0LEK0_MYCCL|nr:predicted protein [Mycena chlorophos]
MINTETNLDLQNPYSQVAERYVAAGHLVHAFATHFERQSAFAGLPEATLDQQRQALSPITLAIQLAASTNQLAPSTSNMPATTPAQSLASSSGGFAAALDPGEDFDNWGGSDDDSDIGDYQSDRPQRPVEPKYQPSEWVPETVHAGRAPWYRPPPVVPDPQPKRGQKLPPVKKFTQGTMADSGKAWFESNTVKLHDQVDEMNRRYWYDRDHRRWLCFPHQKMPAIDTPGVVDEIRFGRPAPPLFVFVRGKKNDFVPTRPSRWMYKRSSPRKGQVGEPSPLTIDQLPELPPTEKMDVDLSVAAPSDSAIPGPHDQAEPESVAPVAAMKVDESQAPVSGPGKDAPYHPARAILTLDAAVTLQGISNIILAKILIIFDIFSTLCQNFINIFTLPIF